jgi:hypothetical protein
LCLRFTVNLQKWVILWKIVKIFMCAVHAAKTIETEILLRNIQNRGLLMSMSMACTHNTRWWWRQCTSETSVYFYETTGRHVPEGCHLHANCCENVKSQDSRKCQLVPLVRLNESEDVTLVTSKILELTQRNFEFLMTVEMIIWKFN